ncbi:CatB-related O-acetyltransferase [Silicimonas algicola]|uniref:Virginiamycin A acetyltransferase n=1 Tax=Silicimonas algicola TaxID=1826607 RepID=A0A316G219_9RHOB|nr:CatB-related O-acetyltransferase [Silicimonas algicola]AZQ65894.1 CatB-related O-acetyltransferase [Silicimonas algicola]PWK54722.1 virginiamycin A acetyltransferase [Silicimonas algicola]
MPFPSPDTRHPLRLPDGSAHPGAVFLKAVVDHPRIEVGDYTYAFENDPPDDWIARKAPYIFPFSAEKLVIGKFCQIASGARFITASANHRYDGISSFPFAIFGGPTVGRPSMPTSFSDTIVGHDVWLGDAATILPGARIGSGVIVGAGAVVSGSIPDYAIVAGNPGRVLRRRFTDGQIDRLMRIAWWDWPIDRILAHESEICGGDVDALERAAP